MTIQTCLFDMGNVLVHFSHEKMCENVARACGVSPDKAKHLLMDDGLQWQLERGKITEADFHRAFEERLGKSVELEALKHAAADIFWLNESIVPLLDELKRLGMRLVLLSNTSVTHLEFIQREFDVLSRFDALTTSFEVGALKPERKIYEDALAKASCAPEECFYTDDIEKYVTTARSLGIHAAVFTDTNSTRRALADLGVAVAMSTGE